MAIQRHESFSGQTSDGLTRTEWFNPDKNPTIAGPYECTTGSGYVFMRTWNGADWISPVSGQPTTVRMQWRGLVPDSIELRHYNVGVRSAIQLFGVYNPKNIAALAA